MRNGNAGVVVVVVVMSVGMWVVHVVQVLCQRSGRAMVERS